MLRTAFERGQNAALTRFGVKTAAGIPTARIVPKGSGVRGPVATPPPMTPAAATASPSLGERARAFASGIPGTAQQFMRPLKSGLGLAALGAGGAMLYGMHRQNQEDRDARNLVYAPMTGAY